MIVATRRGLVATFKGVLCQPAASGVLPDRNWLGAPMRLWPMRVLSLVMGISGFVLPAIRSGAVGRRGAGRIGRCRISDEDSSQ